MLDAAEAKGFAIRPLHHAEAILRFDMPEAIADLDEILQGMAIPIEELVRGGGGEGELTQRLRRSFAEKGWGKHEFVVKKIIDGEEKESVTHEIDHVRQFERGTLALEIEWNNKDPFFDRDLENFKRLHSDGAISIGAILTRGISLQDGIQAKVEEFARKNAITEIRKLEPYYTPTPRQKKLIAEQARRLGSFEKGWAQAFVRDKFGEATTHWRKLEERVNRGVGNPCPLLLIGIPIEVVTE